MRNNRIAEMTHMPTVASMAKYLALAGRGVFPAERPGCKAAANFQSECLALLYRVSPGRPFFLRKGLASCPSLFPSTVVRATRPWRDTGPLLETCGSSQTDPPQKGE